MQIAAFYTVAFSCRIAALSLATQCMPLCYLRCTLRTLRKGRKGCSQALPTAVTKQPLPTHEAIATTARSNRYSRTNKSLLPHEAIATPARSNRYSRTPRTQRLGRRGRTKQSLLPHPSQGPHEATATPAPLAGAARSNRYSRTPRRGRTEQPLLPHKASATTARSNRYYRTKQPLLPHGATATTAPLAGAARSNRYPRMDKLFRAAQALGADEQITPSAQKKRIVRTNEHHHQYDKV